MKTQKWIIALFCCLFLIFGCKNDDTDIKNTDGFWMEIAGKIIPSSDIDYYDFSTHFVYFKKEQAFLKEDLEPGSFTVYTGDTKIYTGTIHPMYLDYMLSGAYLEKRSQYTLAIGFASSPVETIDPRSDSRIIAALKSEGKYHAGLHTEVQSIRFLSDNQVSFDFQLYNPDTFDYLFLDPEKIDIGLFHYYGNGLVFLNEENTKRYYPKISIVQPEPWNSWEKEWLSVIRSGETKQFTITYDQFDPMPKGNYLASFDFSGLPSYFVAQKDLNQSDGRIWLGESSTTLNCTKSN